ncbi:tryptophan synthase subunit alpha, partial [Francisella tularensis subsp. holarctica]|nr:tryptophan synthase subunit alpha [Francisella tularensis subsp. holarctica]
GSATVKIIQNNISNKQKMLNDLTYFVKEMKAATLN